MRKTSCVIICILASFWITIVSARETSIPSFSVTTIPEYTRLIAQEHGWTGADGAYSVALSDTVTLWLYSDTWIGDILNGKHAGGTIINNTVGIQQGKDPQTASMNFYWHMDSTGKPKALMTPADSTGWYWLSDGIYTNQKLYLFLNQMDHIAQQSDSVFNFKGIGTWIAEISNPLDTPTKWKVKQSKIPFGRYNTKNDLSFGTALLQKGNYIYIYGNQSNPGQLYATRSMVVARVPSSKLTDFSQWRFYHRGSWVKDVKQATELFEDAAPEYQVSYLPALKQYVTVFTELGMSKNIQMRISPAPIGPWSPATTIYVCPEVSWNTTYFCYAAKGHTSIATAPNELIVTYAVNSFDFWQMVSDSRIYFPRYLRLTFK